MGFLILGFDTLEVPFKGGVLFPDPFLVKSIPPTPLVGELFLPFTWSEQPGAAYSVYLQYWVQQAGFDWTATEGFSFTEV